jgi:hypothetical protein
LSLEVTSVQEKMTKINTVTTGQLGEMTIVGAFRLSEHSGPLYLQLHYCIQYGSPCLRFIVRQIQNIRQSYCLVGHRYIITNIDI